MNKKLKNKLIGIAQKHQIKSDPSHDFEHILRVLYVAEKLCKEESADADIVIPAALFHDIIVYRKDLKKSRNESDESSEFAAKVLAKIKEYPKGKIPLVQTCIRQCSFSKGIRPDLLEAKVLQDADLLEAMGAVAIMRTFTSGGQMNRPLYVSEDPLREKAKPAKTESGVDLFFTRLLIAKDRLHFRLSKKIALRRTKFLKDFLKELKLELKETGRI